MKPITLMRFVLFAALLPTPGLAEGYSILGEKSSCVLSTCLDSGQYGELLQVENIDQAAGQISPVRANLIRSGMGTGGTTSTYQVITSAEKELRPATSTSSQSDTSGGLIQTVVEGVINSKVKK